MKVGTLRKALWHIVPALEGKKDLPLRHAAALLYVLERGEVSSAELQTVLASAQGVVSRIITDLKGYGLLDVYPDAQQPRRHLLAPSEKGEALKTLIEATV